MFLTCRECVLLYIPDWKHASMESFMSKHSLGCIEKVATASVTSHLDFESSVLEFGQCYAGYLKPRAISEMYTCGPSLVIFHWTGWGGSIWGATCEGTCYSQYWSKSKLVLILHKMRVTTTKWIHCQAVWGCQPSWTAAPSTCLWPVALPVWTGLYSGLLDWIPNAALHQPHARQLTHLHYCRMPWGKQRDILSLTYLATAFYSPMQEVMHAGVDSVVSPEFQDIILCRF